MKKILGLSAIFMLSACAAGMVSDQALQAKVAEQFKTTADKVTISHRSPLADAGRITYIATINNKSYKCTTSIDLEYVADLPTGCGYKPLTSDQIQTQQAEVNGTGILNSGGVQYGINSVLGRIIR